MRARPPMNEAAVLAALDQAVSSAQEVRSTVVGQLPTSETIATWPVTAVQIPWKEWVALIAAIRVSPSEEDR